MCIPAAGATTHLPTRRRGTWILSLWEAVIELRHIPISKTTSGQVWSPVPHLCGNLPSLLHPTFPLDLTIRMGGSGPRSSYWSLFLMMRIDVDTSAPPLRDEEARIGTAERQYGQYIPHDHPSSSCLLSHDTSTEEQVVPPQWIPELPSRIRSSGTFGGQERSWGACAYCAVFGIDQERERRRDLSFLWGPILPTPLDRLKIQHLAIFADPASWRRLPRTDTHHVMGPMQVAYAVL